MFTLDNYS